MTLSRVDSNGSREPHGASTPVPNGAAAAAASAVPNLSAESTPSRPRRRTLEGRDTTTTTTTTSDRTAHRRSSLISRTEAPVPAIPSRFLNPNQDSTPSPRLHKAHNSASYLYNRDDGAPKGEPASSPLAFDFNFSRTSSASPPLRALSHRRLLSSAPRNAVNKSSTNFSSPLARSRSPRPPPPAAAANNTSFHTRAAASLPTTEFTFTTTRPNLSEDQTTLRALTGQNVGMGQAEPEANEDLFLQLAEDTNSTDSEPTLTQGAGARTSWHDKRQQPPSSGSNTSTDNGRPRTTNFLSGRPSSRFSTHIDTNRANNGYRTPGPATATATNFTSPRYDQTTPNNAQLRRTANFSNGVDCSPRSFVRNDRAYSPEKSPELPTFGRRRPSFGYPSASSHNRHSSHSAKPQGSDGDSPANSSEAKQSAAESDSVDSQTAPSTVWDELDDLKSRIKKLELTGKMPPTSGAAVLGGGSSSDRPRTATTAPTTINSSPKQERKAEQDTHAGAQNPKSPTHATLTLADIHPTLHTALSKAKALLSASLYRTLEATAMDALQLVAMTGSAGPQGTTFSAASIINGVTVSDRHIRRKADMMCRNLTDLCLALCEGKHEAPSIMSSPIAMETPPKLPGTKPKYSRSSLAFGEDLSKIGSGSRPLSRLEARRSSILGLQPSNGALNSPQASGDDISASEQEMTPSQPHRALEARRQSRLSNRLSAPRFDRYEDPAGDEDYRPPSRAVTEFGNFRSPLQQHSPREYSSPANKQPHRSPSLRESLNARRANASAMENNREVPRVASLNMDASRRRFARESTPPVLEEEASEIAAAAQQRRRLTSFGHYVSSRRAVDLASRSTSLSHRRPNNVMVE